MKTIFILCFAAIINTATFAQDAATETIPNVVTNAFKAKYPDVKKVEWEIEENTYEADFKIKNEKFTAAYDNLGNWIETEKEIKYDELPSEIKQTILTDFAGYKVEEIEKIETSKKETFYELKIEKGTQELALEFNAAGKMIKQATAEDDDKK